MDIPAITPAQVAFGTAPTISTIPTSGARPHAVLTPCVIPHKEPIKAKTKVSYYQPIRFVFGARLFLRGHGFKVFTPINSHQSRWANAAFKAALLGINGSTLLDKYLRRRVSGRLKRDDTEQTKQHPSHHNTSVVSAQTVNNGEFWRRKKPVVGNALAEPSRNFLSDIDARLRSCTQLVKKMVSCCVPVGRDRFRGIAHGYFNGNPLFPSIVPHDVSPVAVRRGARSGLRPNKVHPMFIEGRTPLEQRAESLANDLFVVRRNIRHCDGKRRLFGTPQCRRDGKQNNAAHKGLPEANLRGSLP